MCNGLKVSQEGGVGVSLKCSCYIGFAILAGTQNIPSLYIDRLS